MQNVMHKIFGASQPAVAMVMGPNGQMMPAAPGMQMPNQNSVTGMPQPVMTMNSDGQVPNDGANPNPAAAANPTEEDYSKLWELPKPDEGQIAEDQPLKFNMDPTKLNAQAGKMDFTKSLTPELLAKVKAGGDEGLAAMLSAMNTIAQQAVVQATMINAKVTEAGLEHTNNRVTKKLPSILREHSIQSALREDNPLFKDPAVAPLIDLIGQQMAQKYPNATPAEIKQHAQKYWLKTAQQASQAYDPNFGKQATVSGLPAMEDLDWSNEPA